MTLAALPAAPPITDYELLRLIGRGSYGDVWLARGVTGIYRAVKIVWRSRFPDADPYEREFRGLREFAAISLQESRQIAVLHVGRNDTAGFFYYVMELADPLDSDNGLIPELYVPRTLKEIHERRGRLAATEVMELAIELSRGLAELHGRGLVHRDVKPSNVIYVGGQPRLADIGLVSAATTAHTFVGTEGFVPPEGPGSPAADVYSLGKLLYEAATGLDRKDYPRLPPNFDVLEDRKEMLELNEIIIRACEPSPDVRYADATALLDDLMLLRAGRSMRRLRANERRIARTLRGGGTLLIVALIASAGAWVERHRATREHVRHEQARPAETIPSAGNPDLRMIAHTRELLEAGDAAHIHQQLASQMLPPASHGNRTAAASGGKSSSTAEANGERMRLLRAKGPGVQQLEFTPDGAALAVHTDDNCVTFWQMSSLQPTRQMDGIGQFAGFSSDGQWLIGTDREAFFQRWSLATGAAESQRSSDPNLVAVPMSGGNTALGVTESNTGTSRIQVWDFATKQATTLWRLLSEEDEEHWDVAKVVFSRDGRLAAIALTSGRGWRAQWSVTVRELASGRIVLSKPSPREVSALAFSADGDLIAIGLRKTGELQLFDLKNNVLRWQRTFGRAAVNCVAFAPDSSALVVGGCGSVAFVCDTLSGKTLNELDGHLGQVRTFAWSADAKTLVSASTAGDVRLWQEPMQPLLVRDYDRTLRKSPLVATASPAHPTQL